MDGAVFLQDSDDEGLAGLTQVPSQINLECQKEDGSDEFSDGSLDELFAEDVSDVPRAKSLFGTIPAEALVNASQNKTVDFDNEVFAIGMESQLSATQSDKEIGNHDNRDNFAQDDLHKMEASTSTSDMTNKGQSNVHCSQVNFFLFAVVFSV